MSARVWSMVRVWVPALAGARGMSSEGPSSVWPLAPVRGVWAGWTVTVMVDVVAVVSMAVISNSV
ncbi:hypothetical protein [Streptomyces sp. NPDC127098]|uniref:hypothetical protein n=1 Tax=Streptomyces sp. NPDC127098 TaxID=3347137 RepID=UPI0036578A66